MLDELIFFNLKDPNLVIWKCLKNQNKKFEAVIKDALIYKLQNVFPIIF